MINTFLRFNIEQTRCITRRGDVVMVKGHYLIVSNKTTDISGDIVVLAMNAAGSCVVSDDLNNIAVGISLSEMSYTELLTLPMSVVRLCSAGVPDTHTIKQTKNPNLFFVEGGECDGDYLVISRDGTPPLRKKIACHDALDKLIQAHDWWYSFSDSLAVHNRADQSRAAIIRMLRELGYSDPVGEYYRIAETMK